MIKKINIMPVAGKGQRFINQNYTIPKPFIKINNQYMFIKAAKSLPIAHKTFFIFMSSSRNKTISYCEIFTPSFLALEAFVFFCLIILSGILLRYV